MNELFDKLIIRLVFTVFICLMLFIYKHMHRFLYPSTRSQMFKRFYPARNPADSVHFFSRLIGIGIIYSEFHFTMSDGVPLALLDFMLQSCIIFAFYLLSIFVIESITLHNFEYSDEILKNKNMAYALVCATHSIGLAFVLNTVLEVSGDSIVMVIFLWLFCMVLMGLATKTFPLLSKISFNRPMIQKNTAVAFSYMGIFWGWTMIIASSLNHELNDLKNYIIRVILKILLSLIILPLFKKGIILVFNIQESESGVAGDSQGELSLGQGLCEGVIFATICYLTSIITGRIHFGTFYPVF